MPARKQKLELTWIGKENRPKLEPRILIEDPELSYHASHRVSEDDIFDNRLIFGDNLLALKALEQEFTGRVQCVYIDPPFNTGQMFEHYDDHLENSIWLTQMRDRLELLRRLLSDTGTLWVHLDDGQVHRARCVLDELFGTDNYLGTVIWEKSDSPRMDADFFSARHDYLLVYARFRDLATFNRLSVELPEHYNRVDEKGRPYYLKPLRAMGGQGETRAARPNLYFALEAPDGTEVFPRLQDGTDGAWRWSFDKCETEKNRIEWVAGRNGWTPYYHVYGDTLKGRPPETIWTHQEVGSNRTSKAEVKALLPHVIPFKTPKPERLLQRVIHIATNPSDLVLDSFAGSGTTGAVAHKMGRRWIMVELGKHCHTHIIPRLKKVIDGDDPGSITESVKWKGGGGFRYFKLGPSLLEKDHYGNWVISKEFNAAMLAEAMCKLEGFIYAPSDEVYWQQGSSTERDFIYVTTQTMTREMLAQLSEEVGEHRSLLICCSAFRVKADAFPNLTLKKIPKAVMRKCEWGHDDYSLEVENLPKAPAETEQEPGESGMSSLFDQGGAE
jgi:adenine-specific DNA-methyltransferase